jgi:P-type conjugative transfer protein TrbL
MSANLTPRVIDTIQHQFIHHLTQTFGYVEHTAMRLFYLIAVIEMVLFGLMWAMKREEAFADFIFKVLKLGLVFAMITLFPTIVQALIDGFTEVALKASPQAAAVMLDPGNLWKYGFDAGVNLLHFSVTYGTANIGISMVYMTLGFGILFLFALLGAQIVFVMVMFYLVAMIALLLIPFGAFSGASHFFEKALSALFKGGVNVFVVVIVMGMGVSIWTQFPIQPLTQTTTLMQPLGLFFSALVFVILAYRLPPIVSDTVGEFRSEWMHRGASSSVSVDTPSSPIQTSVQTSGSMVGGAVSGVGSNPMAAATTVSPNGTGSTSGSTVNLAANVTAAGGQAMSAQPVGNVGGSRKLGDSANVQGFSRDTLRQLKTTFKQAMQESKTPPDSRS